MSTLINLAVQQFYNTWDNTPTEDIIDHLTVQVATHKRNVATAAYDADVLYLHGRVLRQICNDLGLEY